ncbi:hypothetical protein PCANB_002418 [Pneumocystis canis]|nr:hypothetical protein PCANB_002418 [Pneumocystis canis]
MNLEIENNKNKDQVNQLLKPHKTDHSPLKELGTGCLIGFLFGLLAKRLGKITLILFFCTYILSKARFFYHLIKPWNILLYFSEKIWLKKTKNTKEIINSFLLKNIIFKSSFIATFGFSFLYS